MVAANTLQACWFSYAALISGVSHTSITGNVIVNNLTPTDKTGKAPLSLGVSQSPTALAVTGNYLNCRSDLGTMQRTDILPFPIPAPASPVDPMGEALAQLNSWRFLNYEPRYQ